MRGRKGERSGVCQQPSSCQHVIWQQPFCYANTDTLTFTVSLTYMADIPGALFSYLSSLATDLPRIGPVCHLYSHGQARRCWCSNSDKSNITRVTHSSSPLVHHESA